MLLVKESLQMEAIRQPWVPRPFLSSFLCTGEERSAAQNVGQPFPQRKGVAEIWVLRALELAGCLETV